MVVQQAGPVKPAFISENIKTIIALNVVFNSCALIVLLFMANKAYVEVDIMLLVPTATTWIFMNLLFSIILEIMSAKATNHKALLFLIKSYFILSMLLVIGGFLTIYSINFAVFEFVNMVVCLILPFIMLALALKKPRNLLDSSRQE